MSSISHILAGMIILAVLIIIVSIIIIAPETCSISLVVRVMSEAVEKLSISVMLKLNTFL